MIWIKKKKSSTFYCQDTIKLDIETAWNHNEENPITWMVSCRIIWQGEKYLFRDPMEVVEWYNHLAQELNLDPDHIIITLIHNASYDLSYLLPYIRKYMPQGHKYGIFDGVNKCILYRQNCFEFRCTFRLTNASLYKWSTEMKVDHVKQIGMYDYSKVLYQDSELSQQEVDYGTWDVLAMDEAWKKQLAAFHDDITTVPLTSTGYIRRILRRASQKSRYYRQNYFWDNQLNLEQMDMCFNAFAGGYTHNNRFLKDEIIRPGKGQKGKHRDHRTAYIEHLLNDPLPWGRPVMYYDIYSPICRMFKMNIKKVLEKSPEYFTITKIHIYNIKLKDKDNCTMPFFQVSKMYNKSWKEKGGKKVKDLNYFQDNGRLLFMVPDSGHFCTYLDNYMLKIISEQYKFQYIIEKVLIIKNEPMPQVLRDPIDQLFIQKSDKKKEYKELRSKYGEFDERTIFKLYELNQVKKLLNAIYGCFVTSPLRRNYMEGSPELRTDEERSRELNNYYHAMTNFLPYQVGVAITAAQRAEIYEVIQIIGYKNVLYADTDSTFYLSTPEIEKKIKEYINRKQKNSAYVIDSYGEKVYYFDFEEEPDWIAFKGLHSKCYGVITERKKDKEVLQELKVTIAGVPERTMIGVKKGKPIYLTREEELAGITKTAKLRGSAPEIDPWKALEKMEDDFKFKVNAGITCKYVHHYMGKQTVNGHKVETAGGCVIIPLKEKVIKDMDLIEGFDYDVEFNALEGVVDND